MPSTPSAPSWTRQPRTKDGNFWHKAIYPWQVWLDGTYMAQPFYMEYETRYNGMKGCQDSYKQFGIAGAAGRSGDRVGATPDARLPLAVHNSWFVLHDPRGPENAATVVLLVGGDAGRGP